MSQRKFEMLLYREILYDERLLLNSSDIYN